MGLYLLLVCTEILYPPISAKSANQSPSVQATPLGASTAPSLFGAQPASASSTPTFSFGGSGTTGTTPSFGQSTPQTPAFGSTGASAFGSTTGSAFGSSSLFGSSTPQPVKRTKSN